MGLQHYFVSFNYHQASIDNSTKSSRSSLVASFFYLGLKVHDVHIVVQYTYMPMKRKGFVLKCSNVTKRNFCLHLVSVVARSVQTET